MSKIKCPFCEFENYYNRFSFVYKKKFNCKKCQSDIIIKRRLPFLFLFFFLGIFFIFTFEINYDKNYVDVPYYVIREVNKSIPIEKTICENRSFRFSTFGGNVITIGNLVYPNLQITNQEDQWGLFKVNFSYINESRFPYAIYGGENLKKALSENEISVKDADFYSQNYNITIGPKETILVDKPTQKIDKNTNYWAIGTIIEPKIEECKKITDFIFIKENKTFVETKKEEKIIKKMVYELVFDYFRNFSLKNLLDLLIIILLFFVIVWLFFRIKNRINFKEYKYIKKIWNKKKNK